MVDEIVKFTTFENMRKMELDKDNLLADKKGHFGKHTNPHHPDSFRVRRGVIGGYKDEMNPDDIDYCNERMKLLCTNK